MQREKGHVTEDIPEFWRLNYDSKVTRIFYLASRLPRSVEEVMRGQIEWTAEVTLRAREHESMAQFRLSHLSPNNIFSADGYTKKMVYRYNARNPEKNLNTIYEDMPLKGWWPWPKGPQVDTAGNEDQEGSD